MLYKWSVSGPKAGHNITILYVLISRLMCSSCQMYICNKMAKAIDTTGIPIAFTSLNRLPRFISLRSMCE